MSERVISAKQARRFLLAHQGLSPPHSATGKAGVLDYIQRVGCIQFDPLNIAGRNPELVLQARVADFRPSMLDELLYADRKLLDGWDKMMSIYSLEDWPFFQRRREALKRQLTRNEPSVKRVVPHVRRAIEQRGPLSSLDLDFNETVDWSWAPTKVGRAALESMYAWGELIVHHKINTRKAYDLAEHHIPPKLLAADPNPTLERYHDWHALRRIGGIGVMWEKAGDAWLGMLGMKSKERKAAIARLREKGKLIEVQVEGINLPLYMRAEDQSTLAGIMEDKASRPRATILGALDNLLWDRRLIEALFGFSYTWEVYKPASQRQYGYYVLPVLYGDRFIARFEPVRDRKSASLIIRNWWWEDGVRQSGQMRAELKRCIRRFMGFLEVNELRLDPAIETRADLGWLSRLQG